MSMWRMRRIFITRGASPLGLPCSVTRSPLRRLAPFRWLARRARSRRGSVRRGSQHAHDGGGNLPPLALFVRQLPAAGLGERVEPRLPVVLGRAPLGADEFTLFQPLERRV